MSTYLSQMVSNLEVEHNEIPVPVMKDERTFIQKGKICFQFKALGNIALNGFSNQYEIHYPEEIMKFGVQQQELVQIIKKINKTAMENWPCLNCYYYGIGLSLITCYISYLIPHICITDSENFVKEELHILNQDYFNPKGLEIGLKKTALPVGFKQMNSLKKIQITYPKYQQMTLKMTENNQYQLKFIQKQLTILKFIQKNTCLIIN